MYEELVKQCRDCLDSLCGECKYEHLQNAGNFVPCMNALLGEATNAIEDLEGKHFMIKKTAEWLAERVPKWIPVTERLPEKPKNYPHCELRECYFLVTLESTAVVSCGYDFENNRWPECFKVTHWMPLPSAPTEG